MLSFACRGESREACHLIADSLSPRGLRWHGPCATHGHSCWDCPSASSSRVKMRMPGVSGRGCACSPVQMDSGMARFEERGTKFQGELPHWRVSSQRDHLKDQPELNLLPSTRPFSLGQHLHVAEGAFEAQRIALVLSRKQSRAL